MRDREVRTRGDTGDVIRDESHPTLGSDRPRGVRPGDEPVGGCAEGDPRDLSVPTPAPRTMVLGHIRPGEPPVLYLPPPETEAFNSAKSRVTSTLAMLDYLNELTVILLCGVATW